jgi:hypothetical protein
MEVSVKLLLKPRTPLTRLLAFEIRRQTIKNVNIIFYLISRRCRYRAGTRYFRRGIDEDGNVANFNETEQMIFVDNAGSGEEKPPHILSYVQTRGSVPLYWAEINTLRYKPDLQIMEGEERVRWLILVDLFIVLRTPQQLAATKKHLTDLVKIYGEQTLVNLVDHNGYEQPVKEAYEKYFSQVEMTCQNLPPPSGNLIFCASSRFREYSMSTLISTPSANT